MTDKKCLKCGYEWKSKVDDPKMCPRCHAYLKPQEKKVSVEKPSENILVYCPFCGAKLPSQIGNLSISIKPTEEQPSEEKEEHPEEQPLEEEPLEEEQPTEEQLTEEEPELSASEKEKRYSTLSATVKKTYELLHDLTEKFLNPHLYRDFKISDPQLEVLKEAYYHLFELANPHCYPVDTLFEPRKLKEYCEKLHRVIDLFHSVEVIITNKALEKEWTRLEDLFTDLNEVICLE